MQIYSAGKCGLAYVNDLLCETLYECYGIEVYRPMYIADDDGNEEFCLYPYAEIME